MSYYLTVHLFVLLCFESPSLRVIDEDGADQSAVAAINRALRRARWMDGDIVFPEVCPSSPNVILCLKQLDSKGASF